MQRSLRVLATLQGTLHRSARAEQAQALRLLTTVAAQDDHSSWTRFLANSALAGLLVGSAAAWACNPRQASCEQAQQASAGQTQVLARIIMLFLDCQPPPQQGRPLLLCRKSTSSYICVKHTALDALTGCLNIAPTDFERAVTC